MKSFAKLSAALALCLPFAATAHDVWMVPSSTVLSATDSWITVDAAVGNDKFFFNHAPLRLDNLTIVAPDGSVVEGENLNRGKLRSTFDLQLKQAGTYRIAVVNDGVFAKWKEDGKPKSDQDVNVVPGGSRYRDKVNEIQLKTDKDGKFSVKWPQPGL